MSYPWLDDSVPPTFAGTLADVAVRSRMPVNVMDYGAVGDGNTHPLSSYYPSLAAAQVAYPLATSLTQEVDECAINEAIRQCLLLNGTVSDPATTTRTAQRALYIPAGIYVSLHGPLLSLRSVVGFRVLTDGRYATKLRAMASMNRVVDLNGLAHCELDGVSVESKGSGTDESVVVDTGIQLWWDNTVASPTQAARSTTGNKLHMNDVSSCRCRVGMQIGRDGDNNQVDSNDIDQPNLFGRAAFTLLNGAQTLPLATITVDSTAQTSESYAFSTSGGRLSVGGQIVTYTGVTGTTFTGCSGGTGLIADNAEVFQDDLFQDGLKAGHGVASNCFNNSVNHPAVMFWRRNVHIAATGLELVSPEVLNGMETDFYIAGLINPVFIKGGRSESSRRLLKTSGGTVIGGQVNIENFQWATNRIVDDGRFIDFPIPGILNISNLDVQSDPTPIVPVIRATPSRQLTINVQGLAMYSDKAIGTVFSTTGPVDINMTGYRKKVSSAVDTVGNTVGLVTTGLSVAEATNGRMGRATLVAGTKVVANTAVTAVSEIFLMCQTPGGTPGWLQVSARTAATSFTILSSNAADTSVVAWMIVEPA